MNNVMSGDPVTAAIDYGNERNVSTLHSYIIVTLFINPGYCKREFVDFQYCHILID